MKEYEITFITKEDLKETAVKKEIESLGGKILNTSSIGQKTFTYPIKKEKAGFYTTVTFEIDPQKLMDLNKKIGLKEEILRHLIILYKAAKVEAPRAPHAAPQMPKPEKLLPKEEPKLPEPVKELEKPKEIEPAPKEEKPAKKPEEKEPVKKAKPVKKKIEKPAVEKPKVSKEAEEIEKETVSEEDRLKELDKKLDELLKE